jgi:hypothetical protein
MGFQYDPSGISMLGLSEPSKPIHISYPKQICKNPGEKSDQYQSFLQVANALALEMKFFSDDYNKAFKSVEGQTYENLDFSPEATVWDMITGQDLHAEDASVVDGIKNKFDWKAINAAIQGKCGIESYDAIINGTDGVNLDDLTYEEAFDLMCSMLDAKERVFGAYEAIFGSADGLSNSGDVIGKVNDFLDNYKSIDPHNMSVINLFFGLQGKFMDALSKFKDNSVFMGKVQSYIDNSGLSDIQKSAANEIKDEWMTDMRRWDQVSKVSVNCNPDAFGLLFDKANQTMGLDQSQKDAVMAAYNASNGDMNSFSDALDAINVPAALTYTQKAAIKKAFSSAKKTFLQELHTQLLLVAGLTIDQETQIVAAYEASNGDPDLNSIVPPLTAAQKTAVQAALVTAETNYKAFDPDFTKGTNWYDYFHYEMTTIGNKDAVRSLTSDMYNHYMDTKYKTDEADYQGKKDDRIDEEIALMKIEAKHRSEAKARMNSLFKKKSGSSRVAVAKRLKGPVRGGVSSAKRAPSVVAKAHPVVSAPAARHAQSSAGAPGVAKHASAAAMAAGASKKKVSSAAVVQASTVQAKKHSRNENKVI